MCCKFSLNIYDKKVTFQEQRNWCAQVKTEVWMISELVATDPDNFVPIFVHIEMFEQQTSEQGVNRFAL